MRYPTATAEARKQQNLHTNQTVILSMPVPVMRVSTFLLGPSRGNHELTSVRTTHGACSVVVAPSSFAADDLCHGRVGDAPAGSYRPWPW